MSDAVITFGQTSINVQMPQQGPAGPTGPKGDKGDTGDITPELAQAKTEVQLAAQTAKNYAANAQTSATTALNAVQSIATYYYATYKALCADLTPDANKSALVYADTVENNGIYIKQGASGTGSWTKSLFDPNAPSYSAEVSILSAMTHLPASVIQGKLNLRISGRTLVNLVPDGNFEKDSNGDGVADGWIKNYANNTGLSYSLSTNSSYGNKAQRIQSNGSANNARVEVTKVLENGKYYLFLADFYTTVANEAKINIESTESPVTIANCWQTKYVKFAGDGALHTLRCYGAISTAATVDIDGARLYEIPKDTYDKVDIDPEYTGEKFAQKFPYVDSAASTVAARVRSTGKNMFNNTDIIKGCGVNDDAGMLFESGAGYNASNYIPIKSNTQYTITFASGLHKWGAFYDVNKKYISGFSGLSTFTTPLNAVYIRFTMDDASLSTGQLEFGSTATTYEPYKETAQYLPFMQSIPNVCKDEITPEGKHIKRVSDVVTLDGSLEWTLAANKGTGYKVLVKYYSQYFYPEGTNYSEISNIFVKHNGDVLKSIYPIAEGNQCYLGRNYAVVSISNADSGWTDATDPTPQQIKDYINAHPYRMIYALAKPIITDFPMSTMLAEPNGSIIVEPAFQQVLKNNSGTVALPWKVDHLERVAKIVNNETIDVPYTLSSDKLSFTTTDTTAELIVTGILGCQTVLPEISYSYPQNQAAAIAGIFEQQRDQNNQIMSILLDVVSLQLEAK